MYEIEIGVKVEDNLFWIFISNFYISNVYKYKSTFGMLTGFARFYSASELFSEVHVADYYDVRMRTERQHFDGFLRLRSTASWRSLGKAWLFFLRALDWEVCKLRYISKLKKSGSYSSAPGHDIGKVAVKIWTKGAQGRKV